MSIVGLVTVIVGEEWVAEAICPQTDAEEFFPEKGSTAVVAKAVCWGCPVRIQCLDYAVEHNESHGVWGGFTPKERMRLVRGQNPLRRGRSGSAWRPNGHSIACKCYGCKGAA